MTEIELLILFLATVLGAITTSGLGWLDSNNPFNARQFVPGLIRGIIAAVIAFIPAYQGYLGDVTLFTYLGAYLAGGGFDVMVNRGAGILGILQGSTSTTNPPPPPQPQTPTATSKNYTKLFKAAKRLIFLQYLK